MSVEVLAAQVKVGWGLGESAAIAAGGTGKGGVEGEVGESALDRVGLGCFRDETCREAQQHMCCPVLWAELGTCGAKWPPALSIPPTIMLIAPGNGDPPDSDVQVLTAECDLIRNWGHHG